MTRTAEIALRPIAKRRRPGLTPMVDVVFLLLVFFMLAARSDSEFTVPLLPAGSGEESETEYTGAPRLVSVGPDFVKLNGVRVEREALAANVRALMPSPDAIVVLRAVDGADLQGTVEIIDLLAASGIGRVVLAE